MRLLAKFLPGVLRQWYQNNASACGVDRAAFILSFDCDTEKDIEVVEAVHDDLMKRGIVPVYAVPGQLLEKGSDVWQRIATTGAEFINHGYREHTVYHEVTGEYESTLFYHRISLDEVALDIQRGHETVSEVIGAEPRGFRVPHFGTFSQPDQLEFLYKQLAALNYTFSSSTGPRFGITKGPYYEVAKGLHELPVSGCYDNPLRILDSWGFRVQMDRTIGEPMYLEQMRKMVSHLQNRRGLLNYYADPSQIYDWPEFFEVMGEMAPLAAPSYTSYIQGLEA